MTDTHYSSSSASPPAEPPRDRPESADPAPYVPPEAARPPEETAPLPPMQAGEGTPPPESERYVWQPPVPQFPARPAQAPPVQYQQPQMQGAPTYAPQAQQYAMPAPGPAEPQPVPPPPHNMYAAPTYAPPTQVYAPPPSPGVSRARVGRRFARRAVRGARGAGKLFSGGRAPLAVLMLLLLGLVAWLGIDKYNAAHVPKPAPNAVAANGTIVLPPEAKVVQDYISASKNDDIELGWNALSAKEKARRLDKGEDKTIYKQYLDALSQNQVVPNYRFVGAYGFISPMDFSNGGVYYYIEEYAIQGKVSSRPMFFVVDSGGKVDQVYDYLYQAVVASSAQSSPASGSNGP